MAVYFHRKDTEGVDLDEIEINGILEELRVGTTFTI